MMFTDINEIAYGGAGEGETSDLGAIEDIVIREVGEDHRRDVVTITAELPCIGCGRRMLVLAEVGNDMVARCEPFTSPNQPLAREMDVYRRAALWSFCREGGVVLDQCPLCESCAPRFVSKLHPKWR